LERMTRLSIVANPNSAMHVTRVLKQRAGSAELYLQLEKGPASPKQLQERLNKSAATISKICNYLYDEGLIERMPDPASQGSVLWRWHDMERTLGISRVARGVAKGG